MNPESQNTLARSAVAAVAGVIFALGLGLAGMTQPGKVLGFLDVTGDWDPSLACVMGGAAITFGICYRLILRRPAPIFDLHFKMPAAKEIDWQLVGGSALFGVGWGLGGFCPGPGVVSLASGGKGALVFVGTMLLGMATFKLWRDRVDSPPTGDDGQEEPQEQEPIQA
ncbi:MAG: putative membrane protein YedE/YeeE [Cognaticolwellia sp.]|jgi:uncharacterized membrane protein YedE/YeeE